MVPDVTAHPDGGTDPVAGASPDVRAPRTIASPTAHAAGAVVVGAAVAADPGGWYPFGPTKWFTITVLVGAAATVALWRGERPRLPRRFVVVGLAFLGWTALAAAVGRDPVYAWTGTPERRLGFVAWCVFAVCAAIGSTWTTASLLRWSRWATAAAAWCGAYALVELLWRAPIELATTSRRLGGPFGSAAYLGAALCLLLPIAAGVLLDRAESRRWRAVAAFAVVSGTIALVGSGSRAAWVGLGLAVAVALIRLRPCRTVWIGGLAVVCAALLVFAPRLVDVTDRPVPADSRLDEWAMAVRVIAERPVLGAGPEGYRTVVADGVTAEYERTYGRDVLPDRAHSAPLDVAATSGIPGMLLHLALVASAARAAWSALARRDCRTALAGGVLAYLTQQLLLFPLAELDPLLWLAAGALLVREEPGTAPGSGGRSARGDTRRSLAPLTTGMATVVAFGFGLVHVAADRAAGRAVGQPAVDASASAERAVELRPDVVRYRLLVAASAIATGTLDGVDRAIDATDAALDVSPHDPTARQAHANALTERARITGDPRDLVVARTSWQRLVDDDPLCRACQFGLGTAAALDGDDDAARTAWLAAAELSRTDDTRAADALAALDAIAGPEAP